MCSFRIAYKINENKRNKTMQKCNHNILFSCFVNCVVFRDIEKRTHFRFFYTHKRTPITTKNHFVDETPRWYSVFISYESLSNQRLAKLANNWNWKTCLFHVLFYARFGWSVANRDLQSTSRSVIHTEEEEKAKLMYFHFNQLRELFECLRWAANKQ